jgi:hypothetical protein
LIAIHDTILSSTVAAQVSRSGMGVNHPPDVTTFRPAAHQLLSDASDPDTHDGVVPYSQ